MITFQAETAEGTSTRRSRARRVVGRFGWGVADQLLSSFTNFILGLLVARAVGAGALGAFSLAYATYALALGAVRSVAGNVLVVRYSAVSRAEWRHGVRGAAGTALMTGFVVGAGCVTAGAIASGSLRSVLLVVGIFLPSLLVQDVWRFALFALGKGSWAFVNDLIWFVIMALALVILAEAGQSSVGSFTLGWAASGCVAAAVGAIQVRTLPSGPVYATKWLRRHRDLAPRFLAEFAVTNSASALIMFGVGSLAGLAELGRLRAGQIALGPLTVLFGGIGLVATPEAVRLLHQSPANLARAVRWLSFGLAWVPVAVGSALLLVPDGIGESLLGTNWEAARSLVVPLSIGSAAFGASFGPYTGLRSLAAAKRSLRVRSFDALMSLCLALAGAAVAGALGAAWGLAIGGCVEAVIAWWQFGKALSEYDIPGNRLRRAD